MKCKYFSIISFFSLCLYAEDQKEDLTFLQSYDKLKTMTVTPKATPIVEKGYDVSVDLSYILWQPSQGGLAYAIGSVPLIAVANTSNAELVPGKKFRPDFKVGSGFKIGLGCDFDYDGWRGGVKYTWFQAQASSEFFPSKTGGNQTLWEGNFSVISFGQLDNLAVFSNLSKQGRSGWSMNFNTLDLDMSRRFFVSRRLILDPYFGLKAAWIAQKYNIFYYQEGISTAISISNSKKRVIATAAENYVINNRQHFSGAGPEIGMSSSWLFDTRFSLLLDLKVSSLWSVFHVTRKDFSDVVDLGGSSVALSNYNALNQYDHFHQLNTVVESCLAFNYDQWFAQNRYHLQARLGWEMQMWFDQNQFMQQGLSGNLGLQGLVLNFRFDF